MTIVIVPNCLPEKKTKRKSVTVLILNTIRGKVFLEEFPGENFHQLIDHLDTIRRSQEYKE